MARPAKSLRRKIMDHTFRPGRDAHLLAGPELAAWPKIAELQRAYKAAAASDELRAAIARQVSCLVREGRA